MAPVVGFWEDLIGQALALSKTPLDLLRGSGGEEKVLKNAKDACATEALEIATYTAIERLARSVGDDETADLAQRILADEERMLERIMREIPKLTEAVVRAEVKGEPSYDITTTGAGRGGQRGRRGDQDAARKTTPPPTHARQARNVPGVAQVEGEIKGAVAGEDDLAIARYDTLTADEITAKLPGSRRSIWPRSTPTSAEPGPHHDPQPDHCLRGDEPWPGYDELTAPEVQAILADADDERVKEVLSYERAHKDRAGVRTAAEREVTNA